MVVPPPISVIGLLPLCCSQYSIIIGQVVADVQRRRRAVVADIGGRLASRGERVEAVDIGTLVDEAAFLQNIQKIGFKCSHLCATLIILISRYFYSIRRGPRLGAAALRRPVAL